MEEIITKDEFRDFMKIEGKGKGITIRGTIDFVLKKEGEDGLKKLEEVFKNFPQLKDYKKIKMMDFYPIGLYVVTLVAIQRIFNYNDQELRELGRFHAKIPTIIRIFMKYLVSLDILTKAAPLMWKRYYTMGSLTVLEVNKEKKYVVLKLEGSNVHPFTCQTRMGYFSNLLETVIKSKVSCEETKCVHRGDDCHEFLLKW